MALPDHMVPSSFVWLETLPVSPNGKVDLGACRPLDGARGSSRAGWTLATDSKADTLSPSREVLAIEGVGIHDRFFELGGTLQATRFVAALGGRSAR